MTTHREQAEQQILVADQWRSAEAAVRMQIALVHALLSIDEKLADLAADLVSVLDATRRQA